MSLEHTPTGWWAYYDGSGSLPRREVEAWSPDGVALVVDEKAGTLKPANYLPGFTRLARARRVVTAFAALPGWRLRLWDDDKDDTTSFESPIVAWVVDDQGWMLPVSHTSDGYLCPTGQRAEILAPPA